MLKLTKNYLTKQNLIILSLIVSLTMLSIFNLALIFYSPPKVVQAKADETPVKIQFWDDFLSIHPTYFEGWVELSKLQIQNKNLEEALVAYQNAYKINPNSEKLILLQLKLNY